MTTDQYFNRRRIHYVDFTIQMYLIVGLIVLELLILGIAAFLVYHDLANTIESEMYRSHQGGRNLQSIVLPTVLWIMAIMVVCNAVALMIGGLLWRRYVGSVLRPFRTLVRRTAGLDFTLDNVARGHHRVLDLILQWRHQERQRLTQIREITRTIESALQSPEQEAGDIHKHITVLAELCPNVTDSPQRSPS